MRERDRGLRRLRLYVLGGLASLILAACGRGSDSTAQPAAITGPDNAGPAIVRVELLITDGGKATVRYWGSGAFIGPGLVLTSARLLDQAGGWDTIGIAVPGRSGQAASLAYQADVVASDPSLDVAVLKVAADQDGKDIDASKLRLPALSIAGSGGPGFPRRATVLGYTALDGPKATGTRPEFSRGLNGGTDWVESDTVLSSGFGGAPVVDERGQVIGVVALPEPGDDRLYVRRIDEARPLIEAASAGKSLMRSGRERLPAPDRVAVDKPGDLKVSNVTFYRETTPSGDPAGAQSRFPSGTRRIVYAFDYEGMRPGVKWLDEWMVGGRVDPQLSPPRPPWDKKSAGRLVASINDPKGLPDGVYRLRILVGGLEVASGTATVGPAATAARFSRVVVASAKGKESEPVGQAERLDSAATLFGFFDFAGMDDNSTWGYVWYHNGKALVKRDGLRWRGGTAGSGWWVAYYAADGAALPPGTYTLTLLIDRQPAGTATVVVGRGS